MYNLGKRLRALRKERHLTLARLGQQVDLSASHLSQIERGLIMPSLPKLTAIARALGVDMCDFFEEETPPCVVRASQGRILRDGQGILIELLSANLSGKSIYPYRMVCQPGTSCERPLPYPGEECALVLRGTLTITVGDETIQLNAGDSIHYQRHQLHSWRNDGDKACIVVWAMSPPIPDAQFAWQADSTKERG